MANQQAFKGEVTLAFDYKANENSASVRYDIPSEKVSYVMIEDLYENVNILPVIYVSVNLSSDLYTKVVDSNETSRFYLRIRKKNALSNTSVYKKVVEDSFTYVTSTTNANYAETLNDGTIDSYQNIMIGLVSVEMTNQLRTSYNGIYNSTSVSALVNMALSGLGKVIKAPIKYNETFKSFIVPPISSRYKLLYYIFDKSAYYDSMFTFFMDFNKTYLIPKNGEAIDAGDGDCNNVIINVKDYTSSEAYTDGFTAQNGAYVVYVNASDTNMIINNATSKVTNNVVGYWDSYSTTQNLTIDNNNTADNTTKTTFVRSSNAAGIRNELEGNSVIIELLKQNMDTDIFTPNKSYSVSNYSDYEKYDGTYYLSYKREFYYLTEDSEFTISANIGLKKTATEEAAKAVSNAVTKTSKATSYSAKRTTSSSKSSSLTSTSASRSATKKGFVSSK